MVPSVPRLDEGAIVDINLRVHGFAVLWQSKITIWEPPNRFMDEQLRGPYRIWSHEHRFVARNGGTDVITCATSRAGAG